MEEIHKLDFEGVHFELGGFRLLLAHVQAHYSLIKQIKGVQHEDSKLCKLMEDIHNGTESKFSLD